MKKLLGRMFPLLLLLPIIIFFFRLFWPLPKLFTTYDPIFTNDLWIHDYPFKEILNKYLTIGKIPFWTKDIGTGFPIFAESGNGEINFSNIILFYFFPTPMAINLTFILTFIIGILGCYYLFRFLKISPVSSLFSSIAFIFGGSFVARLAHMSYLQAIAFIPWVIFLGLSLAKKMSIPKFLLLIFVITQQIFLGGPQWTLIAIIGLFTLLGFSFLFAKDERKSIKGPALVIFALIFASLLSLPQLLPTFEMQGQSTRNELLAGDARYNFSFTLPRLITFIIPHYYHNEPWLTTRLLDPTLGLYWEQSVYIGILPIIFFLIFLLNKRKNYIAVGLITIAVLSLLISLGKLTPFGYLLNLPGFNNFRVPARYLVLTTLSLSALAGFGLDQFIQNFSSKIRGNFWHYLPYLIIIVTALDLFNTYFNYFPTVSVKKYYQTPPSAQIIAKNERVYTDAIPLQRSWDAVMESNLQLVDTSFDFYKNSLDANFNLLYGISQIRNYSGFSTKRLALNEYLAEKILDPAAVRYLISVKEYNADNFKLLKTIDPPKPGLPPYYIYENESRLNRVRFVSDYTVVKDADEATDLIDKGYFPFNNKVILEKDPHETFSKLLQKEIKITADGDEILEISTQTDQKAILIVADSFYTAWKASINGKETEIIPANVNERALIIPAGKNQIKFWYSKDLFYNGLVLSLISALVLLIFSLVLYIKESKKESFDIK